jgi:hypothetical protein
MVDLRTIDPYSYLEKSFQELVILTNSMLFTHLKKFCLTFLSVTFWSNSSILTPVLTMSSVDGSYQVHCT